MGISRKDFAPTAEPIEKGLASRRPTNPTEGRIRFEADTSELVMYVDGVWEVVWPQSTTPAVPEFLLLETGDSLLLETGDVLLLE
jgi:hypothetical protein